MMNTKTLLTSLAVSISLYGCGGGSSSPNKPPQTLDPQEPTFSANLFSGDSATVDNPWLPLKPGTTYVYEGGDERVEVAVSHETKTIMGIESVVVVDRAYQDGDLVEETFDWYAQDKKGNVWYMGEDSKEYENGEIISSDGSWEAGKDIDGIGSNAKAGIKMKAAPFTIGDTYLQEFYQTVAEDNAKIIATGVAVSVSSVALPGDETETDFTTLQTLEWVPLNANPVATEEYKYFASGVGLVLVTDTSGGGRVELSEVHDDTMPDIEPGSFTASTTIDNAFFPLVPGTTFRYETAVGEDEELIIVEVLADTKVVMGIQCVVVRDRVYINGDETTGLLLEDTHDWYAQDNDGNVWYFGEEVDNYDEDSGALLNHDGSWEAGVNGAQPGIQMKSAPRIGDSYHQEYRAGEAEDIATIVGSDIEVTLSNEETYSTVKMKEWNPLENNSVEYKHYAEGVGLVLETKLDDSGAVLESVELVSMTTE